LHYLSVSLSEILFFCVSDSLSICR
jgi:hypothetical protein